MAALCADTPLSLTLNSELASCETARQALVAFLANHQPSANAIFKVELVLEEVLMNQIRHSFLDRRPDHPLHFRAEVADDTVVLTFADEGVSFNPLQAAPPVLPTLLEAAAPGGLGIFLTQKYVKSMTYERIGGENRLKATLSLR